MRPIGLNPYGLAYTLGIQAAGMPRANPRPWTIAQYLDLAESLHLGGIELHAPHLHGLSDESLRALRQRIEGNGWWARLARPAWGEDWPRTFRVAQLLGVDLVRMHLTPILCGQRGDPGCPWPHRFERLRGELRDLAARLDDHGLRGAIENHQDLTSTELLELCDAAGPAIGITLDTANALAIGEDPLGFARAVAPRTLHLHLKDYLVQWSDSGYRLIRCPTGGGCIPIAAIAGVFADSPVTAAVEIGALESRHIRCFEPLYWQDHPPRAAESFSRCLAAARCGRLAEDADIRTPWETQAPPQVIIDYELAQVHDSVRHLRDLKLL